MPMEVGGDNLWEYVCVYLELRLSEAVTTDGGAEPRRVGQEASTGGWAWGFSTTPFANLIR